MVDMTLSSKLFCATLFLFLPLTWHADLQNAFVINAICEIFSHECQYAKRGHIVYRCYL